MSRLLGEEAVQIFTKHHVKALTFIETGTHIGTTLDAICREQLFQQLYSIELSKGLYQHAEDHFRGYPRLTRILGDSAKVLPELCSKIAAPAFFWLDAHWYEGGGPVASESPCPLMQELRAISERNMSDVVVVDDVPCFGRKWNDGPGGDWTRITQFTILEIFDPKRIVENYVLNQKFVIHLRQKD
jgi:hypothetical protein